jgi:hypothetical protein
VVATYTTDGKLDENETDQSSTHYIITIPDSITVGGNEFKVSASGFIFENQELTVLANPGKEGWQLTDATTGNTVNYKITGTGNVGTYKDAAAAQTISLDNDSGHDVVISVKGVKAYKAEMENDKVKTDDSIEGDDKTVYADEQSSLFLSEISNTSYTMKAVLDGTVPGAGTYTDTVTFSVSCTTKKS